MLRSTAKYAIADITLDFKEGTDIYWARQQVNERFAGVASVLPASVDGGLAPIATPLSDVLMFTIEGNGLSLQDKRSLLAWAVRPALRALPGVADVNVLGGQAKSFVVVPDRARLLANGLHFSDLVQALERNNRNDGAGRINAGENAVVVRVEGALQNESDIGTEVVKAGMTPLRAKDLATVRIDGNTRYGAVTRDGQQNAAESIGVELSGTASSTLGLGAED